MNIEMTPDELFFFDADPGALPLYAVLKEKLLSLLPETLIEIKRTQISFQVTDYNTVISTTQSPITSKAPRTRNDIFLIISRSNPGLTASMSSGATSS